MRVKPKSRARAWSRERECSHIVSSTEMFVKTVKNGRFTLPAIYQYQTMDDLLQGKFMLHVQPQGLQLETQAAEWMVVTEDSYVYLQAEAQDKNGETYTVRIMARFRPQPEAMRSLPYR